MIFPHNIDLNPVAQRQEASPKRPPTYLSAKPLKEALNKMEENEKGEFKNPNLHEGNFM